MIARPACSLVSRLTVRYHFERREEWEDSPEGYPQTPPYQWWNYHDAYDNHA